MEQRKRSLATVNQQIEKMEEKRKALENEIYQENQAINRHQYALRIYEAGMIFKEAGILESYDHDKVLQILQQYKKEEKL